MMGRAWLTLLVVAAAAGCTGGPTPPAALDARTARCATCQNPVLNQRLAAQIAAPDAAPLFFDDIGCMADYVSRHTRMPPGAIAYVADHWTGEWVPATSALYTRNLSVATPADSNLVAHRSAETRQADPVTRGGVSVTLRELTPLDIPDGTR